MPRIAEPHALSLSDARRVWLSAQRLDTEAPFGEGPEATRAAVEHLGYVQIDTINVIERCHHHILYTRIPAYRRADLGHAQTIEKSVFEYWTHALSYIPTRDLRFYVAAMRRHRREGHAWFGNVSAADIRKVMRRLRDGPLSIRDIDDDVLVDKHHPWASRKPSKAALQFAFFMGRVAVSERTGMLKTYDLIERHFGWETPPKPASDRDTAAYRLDRALRSQGVVGLDSVTYGDVSWKPAVRRLIEARVGKKELVAVAIESAGKQEHWARPDTLAAIPAPARSRSIFSRRSTPSSSSGSASGCSSATTISSRPMSRRTSGATATSPSPCSSATASSPSSTSRPTAPRGSCSSSNGPGSTVPRALRSSAASRRSSAGSSVFNSHHSGRRDGRDFDALRGHTSQNGMEPRPMPARPPHILAAALLAGVLLPPLAATAEVASVIPACPLLTPDEVAAVFGSPFTAAEQEPSGGGEGEGRMTTCFWTPADGKPGATLSLVVWSWPPGDGGAAGFLETLRILADETPDRPPAETLAIGDDALWDGDRVYVRKGGTSVTLATSLNALDVTPDAKAKLEALAAIVAGRL